MSDPSNLEHLDEVVSAYVDGEATPEEVRLVEADPALVEQARLLRELVAMDQIEVVPEPDMKRRHLTAAMAAFEAPADAGAEPVVDLTADEPGANEPDAAAPVVDLTSRRRGPAGLPRWLSVAAGAFVVVGGIGFVATQNTSEDSAATDTVESAEEVFSSRPDSADAADGESDAAGSAASDDADFDDADFDDAMEEEAAMEEDAAMEDEAMEQEALEDGEAMEDDEEAADEDTAATDDAGDTAPQPQVSTTADITQDELLALVPGVAVLPVEAATCFGEFTASKTEIEARIGPIDADGQTVEFFGVLIDGEPNEFIVITSAEGERSGVLFNSDCTIVEP